MRSVLSRCDARDFLSPQQRLGLPDTQRPQRTRVPRPRAARVTWQERKAHKRLQTALQTALASGGDVGSADLNFASVVVLLEERAVS